MDLVWHIPSERMHDRIEELREYLERFPDGAMAGPLKKELDYLEAMRDCRFEEAKRLRERL